GSWTSLTNTFVFTPTVGHTGIRIEIDPATALIANLHPSVFLTYCAFIDDISIVPAPTPLFVIPNAGNCGNSTFTDLAQYASVTGTFSGTGITLTGGQYDFNSNATLSPGTYPVAFTYST